MFEYVCINNIFCIFVFSYIPESLRWLHVTGRLKEAHTVIHNCARINGKVLKEPITLLPPKTKEQQINPFLLFRNFRETLKTLNLGLAW